MTVTPTTVRPSDANPFWNRVDNKIELLSSQEQSYIPNKYGTSGIIVSRACSERHRIRAHKKTAKSGPQPTVDIVFNWSDYSHVPLLWTVWETARGVEAKGAFKRWMKRRLCENYPVAIDFQGDNADVRECEIMLRECRRCACASVRGVCAWGTETRTLARMWKTEKYLLNYMWKLHKTIIIFFSFPWNKESL